MDNSSYTVTSSKVLIKTCEHCNKTFTINTKDRRQKFCNKDCFKGFQRRNITKIFCKNPSCRKEILSPSAKAFCSKSCAAKVNNKKVQKKYKKTFNERLEELAQLYFHIDSIDITAEHIEKLLDDIIQLRKIYHYSANKIGLHLKANKSTIEEISKYLASIGIPYSYNENKPKKKPKVTLPKNILYPHSRLITNTCKIKNCSTKFVSRTPRYYCQKHNTRVRETFEFKFNIFDYPDLFDLDLLETLGFYQTGGLKNKPKNLKGMSRDHKVSVYDARANNYDPYYISHVMNCQLLTHKENIRKGRSSSISYDELVILVNKWDLEHEIVRESE